MQTQPQSKPSSIPITTYPHIRFDSNYNNKLNCDSFTSIRLYESEKFKLIDIYDIQLFREVNKQYVSIGLARIQYVKSFCLRHLSPAMAYIDMNLNVIDGQNLLKKLYKSKNVDWHAESLVFIVFQYLTKSELKELEVS
jgi:hypothetical protein